MMPRNKKIRFSGKQPTGQEEKKGTRPMGLERVPVGFKASGKNTFRRALTGALRKPKHVLTPEYTASLWELASRLPATDKYGGPLTGAKLLAREPDLLTAAGEPLDPEKLYFVHSEAAVNAHMDALEKAYVRGGQDAVVEYLRPYEKFLAED